MKTRAFVLVSGVLFLAAAAICVADCPETSSCTMTHGTVTVEGDGDFSFALYPSWAMKADPSWVVLQFKKMGSVNIEDLSVKYTPSFWTNKDCVGNETSTCTGTLESTDYDGNVQTQLNVGVSPDNCGSVLATYIPKP